MAAVILPSEENSFFSPSTLRRSHSQPKFVTKQTGFRTSSSTSRISDLYPQSESFEDSSVSSAPSSPRTTQVETSDLSCSSTPATNCSLASDCDDEDGSLGSATPEHIVLPQYDDVGYFNHADSDLEPPPSPKTESSNTSSSNDQGTSTSTSRPGSPDLLERAEDDIAIKVQPSRHVDYLSHNWREEDIWSSWKHIVSRRGNYDNSARLENASWRTWMKSKNKLSTVSPETLNWLKDYDVTWLYGPLQTCTANLDPIHTDMNSARLSKNNSFVSKKPILKKRSMSELMLQRSLSASSLVKQAAAAVQAQQKGGLKRPGLGRAQTDYITFQFSSRGSHDNTSLFPSAVSSGVISPSGERKHIHFNEQVEQCIAVDVKGEDDDDEADTAPYNYDSDSDDGAIMMKRTATKKRPLLPKRKSKTHTTGAESKTIAMLPSTTLKYREDTPEPAESAMKHSTGVAYRSPLISPSSSQETLRPSKKSGKFFMDDDEDDEDEDDDDDNAGWMSSTKSGLSSGLSRSLSSSSLSAEPSGMRRTPSGMFMPVEEGGFDAANEGLFGRVIDTKEATLSNAHRLRNGSKKSFY